jgi:hypothetical protein
MPAKKPIPPDWPSEELLLAAVDRADRHRRREEPGALLANIVEHLGRKHAPWISRRLRPKLEALQTAGLIERSRRGEITLWSLTSSGHARLDTLRQTDRLPPLPESPQHRAWREAQAAANDRIDGFRRDLADALAEANRLHHTEPHPSSDTWYQRARDLSHACRTLASATHCHYEWPEPDDATADIDTHRERSRREFRRWDES